MAIDTACSGCGKVYQLDDSFKGKKVCCKGCGQPFVVGGALKSDDLGFAPEKEYSPAPAQQKKKRAWVHPSQVKKDFSSQMAAVDTNCTIKEMENKMPHGLAETTWFYADRRARTYIERNAEPECPCCGEVNSQMREVVWKVSHHEPPSRGESLAAGLAGAIASGGTYTAVGRGSTNSKIYPTYHNICDPCWQKIKQYKSKMFLYQCVFWAIIGVMFVASIVLVATNTGPKKDTTSLIAAGCLFVLGFAVGIPGGMIFLRKTVPPGLRFMSGGRIRLTELNDAPTP